MELIDIVDENGNFTGQVMDKEKAHDKNLLTAFSAILIISGCSGKAWMCLCMIPIPTSLIVWMIIRKMI